MTVHPGVFRSACDHFAWASMAVNVLQPTRDGWEAAKDRLVSLLAKFFDAEKRDIVLFHNTTTAAQRALSRVLHVLGPREATLLTSDLEYPGIMAMLDEAWPGPLHVVEMESMVWNGDWAGAAEALKRAFLFVRPDVVYLSHVARGSGHVIADDMISYFRATRPRTIIILDGAQAAGNIPISKTITDASDVYITSGHKWLGGKPTLGIALAQRSWSLADPAQSYSRERGSAGTGDSVTLTATAAAIEEFIGEATDVPSRMAQIHKGAVGLANSFRQKLKGEEVGLYAAPVPPDALTSGIVPIVGKREVIRRALASLGTEAVQHSAPDPSKPTVSLVEQERWRELEGADACRERHFIAFDRAKPVIRPVLSMRDQLTPEPKLFMRCCLHGLAHSDESVDKLVRLISSAARDGG